MRSLIFFLVALLLLGLSAGQAHAAYPGVLVADRHQVTAGLTSGDTDAFAIELAIEKRVIFLEAVRGVEYEEFD